MGSRYLFGTVTGAAPAILQADRQAGRSLLFGDGPGLDVVIPPGATWPTVEDRLPAWWRPDFLLLDLSVAPIPTWSWTAPVPVVGLSPIGGATSGPARRLWRRCDRILAGPVVDRARSSDSPADWDVLIAALDREWPEIALRAAGRRAGNDDGSPITALEWALDEDPFDLDAARALFEALGAAGEVRRRRRLAHDRRLLSESAPELVPREPWFAEAPPPGDERASIVILCCNQLECTRPCVESVLRWTRPPYELLLVDNGSSDGTAGYLEEVRARPGPDRVEVIRNATNRGFPAGCNQGIDRARGGYLVLLNNDTVVTEGWLDGLIARAVRDWPNVGLVGAVSNATAPPQQVEPGYDVWTLDGLDAFAAGRRLAFAGRTMRVERLTGFCLLIRRDVLHRIGQLDERYGLGFFDDDDLSVRAREAGFHLLVALDVFVHHHGSRTFAGLGIDRRRQLEENYARFREKWGPERSAGYRIVPMGTRSRVAAPGLAPCPTAAPPPRISLCMIVKNEEANLADCLASAADLVSEVIVVDTGSTDATAAVASRFGARVYPFPWVDSFAAARNESLRHAQCDWIFWLDGDERLDEENRRQLRSLLAGLKDENAAYVMSQRSPAAPGSKAAVVVDQVRLFRRLPQIRWSYRIHEQILPALRRTGVDLRRSDVVIQHAGHEDPALRGRKLERDLRLLLMEHEEQPDEPFILFNLGALYHETNRPADALPLLRRSLERSRPRDSIVPKLHALIVACLRKLRRPREALDACRAGRQQAADGELLFHEALILRELGDAAGAEATLLDLLGTSPAGRFVNGDDGLRGYKARHNLAVIYEETGRAAEAEAQWRAAVAENPQFTPGWRRLGELYLKQRRWTDLEGAAMGLAACPGGGAKAGALRTRALEVRREGPPPAAKPRVSLCMIVKDEEAALGPCLASVADLVGEMIIVDTGSTDRTREVALRAGARVIDFAWVDDFSAARNESIRHASGDWIFWLDADERLDAANREALRAVLAGLKRENAAYLMQQLSTTDDPSGSRVAVDHVRLFRRDPAVRWDYRVHEQILLSIRRAGHELRRTDVVITHSGYAAPGSSDRKLERNLALLLRQDADRPDDPITLYHLGQAYQRQGRAPEALPILRRSLELVPPDYSIRPRLFAAIARAHEALGQAAEALAVCRAGREEDPDREELLFLEAALLHGQGDEDGAEERLLRLLQTPAGDRLAAGDAGRRGYKARHLLAEVYRCQGRPADAEAQWRLVVAEEPRFAPAWQGLGALGLAPFKSSRE